MNQENNYHISFFKPTTARAKYNRNMVIWLVSIWAVAIFGFQILLRVLEKPTPEPELIAFNEVWESVASGNATTNQLITFTKSTLHVTGKVFISTEHRVALDNGISWALMQLADSTQKIALSNAIIDFENETTNLNSLKDESYINAKQKLSAISLTNLGLDPNNVLAKILPLELRSSGLLLFSKENKAIVEVCMPLYTTHNRSVLTDTKFLGFPFHYFYTAVFLLILFIGLCLLYCYRVDVYNKKVGVTD